MVMLEALIERDGLRSASGAAREPWRRDLTADHLDPPLPRRPDLAREPDRRLPRLQQAARHPAGRRLRSRPDRRGPAPRCAPICCRRRWPGWPSPIAATSPDTASASTRCCTGWSPRPGPVAAPHRPETQLTSGRGRRRSGDRDHPLDRDPGPRRAISAGTLTSVTPSRRHSRSLGRVIIFMYRHEAASLAATKSTSGAAWRSGWSIPVSVATIAVRRPHPMVRTPPRLPGVGEHAARRQHPHPGGIDVTGGHVLHHARRAAALRMDQEIGVRMRRGARRRCRPA